MIGWTRAQALGVANDTDLSNITYSRIAVLQPVLTDSLQLHKLGDTLSLALRIHDWFGERELLWNQNEFDQHRFPMKLHVSACSQACPSDRFTSFAEDYHSSSAADD